MRKAAEEGIRDIFFFRTRSRDFNKQLRLFAQIERLMRCIFYDKFKAIIVIKCVKYVYRHTVLIDCILN